MWKNVYKDYPQDGKWIRETVESGKGIRGCEMHEINGWGDTLTVEEFKKSGWFSTLCKRISRKKV